MRRAAAAAVCFAAWLAVLCGFTARPGTSASPLSLSVIVTAAPQYDPLAALHGGERFPQGANLLLLRDGHLTPLAPQLADSADASVSFDGKSVLFAAKPSPSDPWQIWKLDLPAGRPHLVLAGPTDLIRPMWMPAGRMVFARREPSGYTLVTSSLDGSSPLRLSYLPGNFLPDDVLRDGRVLFESGFPLGLGTRPEIYAVYADGSGVEALRCDHREAQAQGGREHARELASGDIVFAQAGRLERFTSALASEAPIPAPPGDYAGNVAELPNGHWLLAVRSPRERRFELALWKPPVAPRFPGDPEARPSAPSLTAVARDPRLDLVDPALVAPRIVPKIHPSGLHPWTTGNLLALDSRLSRSGELNIAPATVRVESLDPQHHVILLGVAPVAKDGSFFVRAAADRPLRFVLLDAHGRVLRQEHGWFWIRRGEQRVCVGCHTGPERAPNNRVPLILNTSTVPANATGAGGH